MNQILNDAANALMWILQQVESYLSNFQAHDLWSIIVGMVAATLFEIPIISRFKRH